MTFPLSESMTRSVPGFRQTISKRRCGSSYAIGELSAWVPIGQRAISVIALRSTTATACLSVRLMINPGSVMEVSSFNGTAAWAGTRKLAGIATTKRRTMPRTHQRASAFRETTEAR